MTFGWPYLDAIAVVVLVLVTAQRLAELVYARFNEVRLRRIGGVEHGASHYPMIVALHAAWLAGLWLAASGTHPHYAWLAARPHGRTRRGIECLQEGRRPPPCLERVAGCLLT
jgi:hypothetical protein